jgi:hypothetical protein
VAWAPRSAAASAAAFGAAPDAVLADGASVADASPLRRAVPPVVRADVQAAGLQRALSRTEATAVEGSTASRLRRAGAESVEGAAMRDATADGDAPRAMARLEATVRAPRLGVPFAETLSAQVPADGVAATLPLGAPGEGRVVRTATRAASSVTVRVPMRAGRALQVAGRDGLDVGTWMRWRASAVRGDAPASVTVEGEGATEVAAQIARWERVRGVAGAMARPTGPLLPPTVARSSSQGPARENAPSTAPILATADAAAYAPSTLSEAGDVRLPSARRRRSASVVAALRSERPVGTTLAASMDGGAMAAAAVASAGFTATWSAGRREDGQPAGYAHRALAADTPARTAGVRPDLAYLEAATPELGEAAPALGEPLTRVVRGGRRGAAVGRNGDVDAGLEGTSGGMPSEERGPTRLGRAGAGAPVRGTEPTAARSSAGPTPSLAGVGRAGNALFTALARSTTAAEVATVLLDAPGAAAAELAEALPEPAARAVYEVTRMRTLPESEAAVLAPGPARQGGGAVAQAASASSSSSNLRATLAAGVRRVRRSGGGGGPTTVGQDGHGEGRLMKLSQKLLGLIHLAERQQTDATRQVRRSDEKVGAASQGRAGQVEGADGVTLASLQREVLEAVQRELERSRERGEGGRYGDFWW